MHLCGIFYKKCVKVCKSANIATIVALFITKMSLGIYGSSILTLDTKGRIVIPARYRELLRKSCEGEMAVTQDPQYPALIIYSANCGNKSQKSSRI